ncbi:MAG TPA: hypothetical protein VGH51_02110 [Candidatus Angelobacter sp.]|jgi:hypothetical protein
MPRRKKTQTRKGKPISSVYPGVYVDNSPYRSKRYKATIHSKGKTVQLGRFALEIDAAQAYRDALLIYPL